MNEKMYQFAGLMGFIISALLFLVVAIRNQDMLTTLGTLIWIASCVVWMVPLLETTAKRGKK